MAKKSEINKKGRLAKSTLSVVLAASMVLTSSSFVWAAPVEDIAIVEEGAESAAGSTAAPVEEIQTADETENVGAVNIEYTFPSKTFPLEESSFDRDVDANVRDAIYSAIAATKVPRNKNGVSDIASANYTPIDYMALDDYYIVNIYNEKGEPTEFTGLENGTPEKIAAIKAKLPVDVGTYTLEIKGNRTEVVEGQNTFAAVGDPITATFSIVDPIEIPAHVEFKNEDENGFAATYTGQKCEPEVESVEVKVDVDDVGVTLREGTDYTVKGYGNNINACLKDDPDAAYVEIQFEGAYTARGTEKYPFGIKQASLNSNNTEITVTNTPARFNSDKQVPVLKVMYNPGTGFDKRELVAGTDYEVTTYTHNVDGERNADKVDAKARGKYCVRINGINNYTNLDADLDEVDLVMHEGFEIIQGLFNDKTITVSPLVVPFGTPGQQQPATGLEVLDKASGEKLDAGDYTVLYAQKSSISSETTYSTTAPTTPGTHGILVRSTNKNYGNGEVLSTYIVSDGSTLSDYVLKNKSNIKFEDNNVNGLVKNGYEYDLLGNAPIELRIGNAIFKPGSEVVTGGDVYATYFTVDFPSKEECKDVGTYYLTLTGKENTIFAGQTEKIPFDILPKELDGADVYSAGIHRTSTGTLVTSLVAADYSEKDESVFHQLVRGTDYDMKYTSVGNGLYKLNVTFKGNYKGSTDFEGELFEIEPLDLNAENITAEVKGEYIYTGQRIKPAGENIVLTEVNGDKSTVLREGIDYKIVDYGTNLNVGKGYVIVDAVELDSFYTGYRIIEFEIKAGDTEKDNYVLDTSKLKAVYETGTTFTPASDILVKTKAGKVLASSEYTLKYFRNGKETKDYSSAGSVMMEITINATKTKLTASYRVASALDKAADIPATIADQDYTGSAVTPEIKLVKRGTTIALTKDKDYTVSYTNNTNVGTATVVIEGIGDYYGTYVRTFKIVGQMEQDIVVLPAQERDLGNGSRTLKSKATKVKYVVEPKTETTYASSNPEVVKVDAKTGAIEYTGVGTAKITISAAESETYKAASKELTVKVVPVTPANVKVTSTAKRTISVKAGEVKEAAKYQIRIQKLGCKSVYVNVDNKGALSKVYTTKSSGKFNVWVRAYKTIDGVHHFSAWSPVQRVTVK